MANVIGGSVVWNLDVDTKGLDSGLSSARKSVDSAASDIEKRGDKMVGALKNAAFAIGAAIGTAAGAFALLGIKAAADLESATQGFVALLGSADEANAVIARIKREAAATPFEIAGLVAGTQAMTAITKDGDKAIDIILDVGKAIAVSGKGQEEFNRVITNLQSVASIGKVNEMDLKEFRRAVPIFDDIIGAVGLTSEELKDADNSAELLFNAFKVAGQEGGIAAKGFSAQAGTFNQLTSNLKDTLAITASDVIAQTGLFDTFKGIIEGATDAIKALGDVLIDISANWKEFEGEIKAVGTALLFVTLPALVEFTNTLTKRTIGALIDATKYVGKFYLSIGKTLISALFTAGGAIAGFATTIFATIIPAIVAVLTAFGPFILIAAVIVGAVILLKKAWETNFLGIRDIVASAFEFVKGVFNGFIQAMIGLGTFTVNAVKAIAAPFVWLYTNVIQPIQALITAVILRGFYEIFQFTSKMGVAIYSFLKDRVFIPLFNVVGSVLNGIKNIFVSVFGFIKDKIVIPVAGAIVSVIKIIWGALASVVNGIWNGVKNAISGPLNAAKDLVGNILNGIKTTLENVFNGIINFFVNNAGRIADAITKPFNDAKRKVEEIGQGIKNAADKINPFHRESPSLVDNVKKGLSVIEKAYANIQIPEYNPSIMGAVAGDLGTGSVNNQRTININNQITMQRESDINALSRRLSFEAQTI